MSYYFRNCTYLIELVNQLIVFFVHKLYYGDWLEIFVTFHVVCCLLDAVSVRYHFLAMAIDGHEHEVSNVWRARDVVYLGLPVCEVRNRISSYNITRLEDLTWDSKRIWEFVPCSSSKFAFYGLFPLLKSYPLAICLLSLLIDYDGIWSFFIKCKKLIIFIIAEQDANPLEAKVTRQDVTAIHHEIRVAALCTDHTSSPYSFSHLNLCILEVFTGLELLDLRLNKVSVVSEENFIKICETFVDFPFCMSIFFLFWLNLNAGKYFTILSEDRMNHIWILAGCSARVIVPFEPWFVHFFLSRVDDIEGTSIKKSSLNVKPILRDFFTCHETLLR